MALQKPADDETIVTYTLDHLDVYDQPPRHYRVKVKPDVPFSPGAKAEAGDKNDGKTTRNFTLGEGNASELFLPCIRRAKYQSQCAINEELEWLKLRKVIPKLCNPLRTL